MRLDWMDKEERAIWDAMTPERQHELNMKMADQFAWSNNLKAELERQHNTPERTARRERIAERIGRPLDCDMTTLDHRWEQYVATGTWDGKEDEKGKEK